MNIYTVSAIAWIVFSQMLKASYGHNKLSQEKSNRIILFSFVILFGSIMAFRDISVGTDTWLYSNIYIEAGQSTNVFKYYMFSKAPVYVVICRIFYIFFKSRNAMMIISAFTTVGINAYFIKKKSQDIIMSLYLFLALDYYLFAFNASRQLLAMSFVLLAYLGFEERKTKRALAWLLVACGVHYLAALFFIVVPLFYIRINPRRFYLISFTTLLFELSAMKLLGILQKIASDYSDLNAMGYDLSKGDSGGNRIFYALFFLTLEIVILQLHKKNLCEKNNEILLRYFCIANVGLFMMIIYRHFYVFVRIEKVFCQFLIVLLPLMYKKLFKKESRQLVNVLTGILFFIPYEVQSLKYLPYLFWKG